MNHSISRAITLGFLLSLSAAATAQVQGDEDKDMYNKAQLRDQKEINKAENGWWKLSMEKHDQRLRWWRDAKFGMFIHWGVYSQAAGEWKGKHVNGYSEHLMRKEKISRADYLDLAHHFNPEHFDADKWVRMAKNAGMNYLIITAKHHDGFAMYPSKVSSFNISAQTPFKRDPMAELAAAAKKYGVKFGFYYSHAFDWEDPDAPGNDWEYQNPGGDRLIGGANWYDQHPDWLPKAVKYVNEKAIPQIQELIRLYHPDILWFDTPHKLPFSENLRILEAIRKADPDVVVNGRLARNGNTNYGDYKNTGDRPAEFAPVNGDWEAIPTTNESYGYSKNDHSHKSAGFFVRLLAKSASMGGNLLLNIGPMGNGVFDSRDTRILESIAGWNKKNSESIYKASKTPLPLQSWGVTTLGENKLYLHVFNWPANGQLAVGGIVSGVGKPYFLSDPSKKELSVQQNGSQVLVRLPSVMPDSLNTVIVLPLKEKLKVDSMRLVAYAGLSTRLLAFDAVLEGQGFKFGDGKTNKYYVDGWKTTAQSISWNFKTSAAAEYQVFIKYIPTENSSKYVFQADQSNAQKETLSLPKSTEPVREGLGKIKLDAGLHHLSLKAVEKPKTEVMKLLELELVPVP